MISWREREARAAAEARDENELVAATLEDGSETARFVCECGSPRCRRPVDVTRAEYAEARAESTRFVVFCHHENPEADLVITECDRFAIVRKVGGWDLRVARATDRRSASVRLAGGPS